MNGIRRCALIGTLLAALFGIGGCTAYPYPLYADRYDPMMDFEAARLRYRVTAFIDYLKDARGPTLDYRGHIDFYQEADDIVAGLMLRSSNLEYQKRERVLTIGQRELRGLLRKLEIEHRSLTCARQSPPCKIRITLECRSGGSCDTRQVSAPVAQRRPASAALRSCRRCQSQGGYQGQNQPPTTACQPNRDAARSVSGSSCSQLITCPQSGQDNCKLDDEEIAAQLLAKLKEIDALLWTL